MGALHAGHKALMERASQETKTPVSSIFVNPLQFGKNEDLDKYPKQEQADCELAEAAGIQYVYIPSASELTENIQTTVQVSGVTESYEGSRRPGHFEGVATIVTKLFMIVGCDIAYFGLKDLQQCAVIQRLVQDLNLPVELRFHETIRESTGLALSSRNAYFSEDERTEAAILFKTLSNIAQRTQEDNQQFQPALFEATQALEQAGFNLEYLDCVDPETMEQTPSSNPNARLVVAGKFKGVRLIDNIALHRS